MTLRVDVRDGVDGILNRKHMFIAALVAAALLVPRIVSAQIDTARQIEITCGGTKVAITCGTAKNVTYDKNQFCLHNDLLFTMPDNTAVSPPLPPNYEATTPVAISCVPGADKQTYVLVDYLEGYYNCGRCHSLRVYTPRAEDRGSILKYSAHFFEGSVEDWRAMKIEEIRPGPDPSDPNLQGNSPIRSREDTPPATTQTKKVKQNGYEQEKQ